MIASPNYISPEEYLQMEEKSSIKHEYIDGYICKLDGSIDSHVTIAGNLGVLLRNKLRGSEYRVYILAMKARIESLNRYYYPDVMVTCDSRDLETPVYKRFPCLIVEVLSDSTEAFDRGDKFADYQTIESLKEYILINTKRQRVDCFRLNDDDFWVLQTYTSQEQPFRLNSINFEATITELYEDVVFE
ncbi:Uma2 family endonuclease [Nostoc spongiaeforme FACHB-130]|uniref:Uma2 family endonuclease n=1 Tax=Nostoc spongiaeforme FACHB-130 TaxID=1357510 RepID=A0ABR8FQB2_9NOSO|nr:Uma2 family endonuclease [Nostoc spongiaeforme]MBD2593387.1 Uma2 family endonuclease [Nostoc spongiaeforme FACHB-130]